MTDPTENLTWFNEEMNDCADPGFQKTYGLKMLRRLVPSLTVLIFLFILVTLIYTGMFRDRNACILMALLTISLLLYNVSAWRLTSSLFQGLSRRKDWEISKKRYENMIALSKQAAEHEENVYKLHHDIHNHLGVIYSMLAEGQDGKAAEYTRKLLKPLEGEKKKC